MMGLSRPRSDGLRRLLELTGRGIVTGGDAEELLSVLFKTFAASAGAFTQSFGFRDFMVGVDVRREWIDTYLALRHQDPFIELLATLPPGEAFFTAGDTTDQQKRGEIWHAFRAHGYRDAMQARLYNPLVSDLYMVLYRQDGERPFSRSDRDLFQLVYPHVAGALAARRALAALEEPASETLDNVLARLSGHAWLSLPAGDVSWSAGARALWERRLGLSARDWHRADDALRASARRFHAALTGGRSQLVFPGIRVEWASVPARPYEKRRLLALMLEEGFEPTADPAPAEALLSPRQRAIARLAVGGMSAIAIADELGIKVTTVRGYIREIYGRLGVTTRAELAAALSQRGAMVRE